MEAITGPEEYWPRTEPEALAVQEALRARVDLADRSPAPGTAGAPVTGVDVAYDDERGVVVAAAVTPDGAGLHVLEEVTAQARVSFPYVPGLLAFREIPAVLAALARLRRQPALLVCDGYGLAHPRRFGLASHLGVLTGLPSIGVAKSPFRFGHGQVADRRGASAPLLDGGQEVGRALRTRRGVKPVYVSVGHAVSLPAACAHVLALTPRFRLPETTRRADASCRAALRAATRLSTEAGQGSDGGGAGVP